MADPDRDAPRTRPDHPGNFPTSKGTSNVRRGLGIAIAIVVLVALLWWLFGSSTQMPGQEHTLGEPAGVGTASPEAEGNVDPAADPDDPQAAIGADPFTEPTSPEAAEQLEPPSPADDAGQTGPAAQ